MIADLEQELALTKRQLVDLREEQRNFLYRISHDLNAPIRHIDGFSHLILESNLENFDDETKKYFDIILKSNLQLGAMLEALLRLSRLSTRQRPFEVLETDKLIETVLSGSLSEKIETTAAKIEVLSLPNLLGDQDQIALLFEELLKNALSFVPPETRPDIQISAMETDTYIQFQIKDNGIGVHAKSGKKIFELFTRDVDQNVYPGHGVGLAIASKIVSRHNGKIWVEENSPLGSIFYIQFPKTNID